MQAVEICKNGICCAWENDRALFLLWEFIAAEGLQDEAREYIELREDITVPFSIGCRKCLCMAGNPCR